MDVDGRRLDRNNFELRPRVRRRLDEARTALDALTQAQHEYLNPAEAPDDALSFTRPKQRMHMDVYELDALTQAFDTLESHLRTHLKAEEDDVYPALRMFLRVGGSVTPLLETQKQEHVDLLHAGAAVRREMGFVPPMRKPMSALLQHLEKQIEYEETRVFPGLMGQTVQDETPIPNRYRTSTDVAKALRKARPAPPEPEPEGGLLAGLFGKWVKNRR